MNKSQSIKLLESEGWTKADAMRALEVIDFSTNPDEITIRRAISPFAGSELIKRQRLWQLLQSYNQDNQFFFRLSLNQRRFSLLIPLLSNQKIISPMNSR
ncbi:hypothetical protein [Nostoc flagelliforme]|uniref:hypothetical protein n=1 Tax=Nostoc flagelliforme TaxID=1306274 RepID=UPI000C2D2302|nr:hypothetical protein [Nostoc flagelliforme]